MRKIAVDKSTSRVVASVAVGCAVALLALVAGCGSAPLAPKLTTLKATLQASPNVNPDLRARASPLVVRVYELKSSAAFDAADFLSLYDREQATLGAEVVGREEFTLRPGEGRVWEKGVGPEVRFLGVMAAFRDIERGRWKALVAVKAGVRNQVTIKADDIVVTASVVAP